MRLANTEVRLLKGVPLFKGNSHTLHFDSRSAQTTYMIGKSVDTKTNLTYQREGGFVRWKTDTQNVDQIMSCNYLMYRNINDGNKWYYVFVTSVEYINDNMVNIHLETDYFQTYMFDITVKPSLIERKHLKAPNLVDEGLNFGSEYIEEKNLRLGTNTSDEVSFLVITSSVDFDDPKRKHGGSKIGGVPLPFIFYVVPFSTNRDITFTLNSVTLQSTTGVMGRIATDEELVDKVVSINAIKTLPFDYTVNKLSDSINIISSFLETTPSGSEQIATVKWTQATNNQVKTHNFNVDSSHTGTKLAQYPYTYVEVYTPHGVSIKLKPEHIPSNNLTIKERAIISYDPKVLYTISNYANESEFAINFETNVNADIPVVTNQTSAFMQSHRNAMTNSFRNAVMSGAMRTGIAGSYGGTSSAVIGGLAGGITGGLGFAINTYGEMKDLENAPNKILGGVPNTIFDFAYNQMQGGYVRVMTLPPQRATQLKAFFHKFGYKVNEILNPLERTRQNFMYVKTIDVKIIGNVPVNALEDITSMFNNGFTLWYNKDVGNYNLSNGVI